MNRRDAIKRTTLLLGSTLSASAILGVMSGCKADPTLTWESQFLTPAEGNIVEQMAERIIPKTDTPGAIDAGVPSFIDQMLAGYYSGKEQSMFRKALAQVDEDSNSAYGKSFVELTAQQQDELLGRYDEEAFGSQPDKEHFFRMVKSLTVLGFCTSKLGATEFLAYEAVPGDYKGCIPYSDVGKAWATR